MLPDYPHRQEEGVWEFKAKLEKGSPSDVSSRNLGVRVCRFTSKDMRQIAQFGLQSFSFHRLPPYTSWADVSREALRLWATYRGAMQPREVTRLAVRNINQMILPAGEPVERYLNITPGLPSNLAVNRVENSLLRHTISKQDGGEMFSASVLLALRQTPGGCPQATLDVDTYSTGVLSPGDPRIEVRLERLHIFKKDIFFGFLTEAAIEKYR